MSDIFQGGDFMEVPSRTELQRILECPICHAVPISSIYNCAEGHIVCGSCVLIVRECGICRSEYTDSRNFVVEEIVRRSKMACEFSEQGCGLALAGDDFKKHLEQCDVRPIKCVLFGDDGCRSSEVTFENYGTHLVEVHSFMILRPESSPFVLSYSLAGLATVDSTWHPKVCVMHDQKVFLPRFFFQANTFHFTLTTVGSESDASKYKVRLRLKQPGDSVARMECVVPVVSVRKSNDEIMDEVHCLVPQRIMEKNICKVEAMAESEEALVWEIEYEILSKSY